MGRKAVRHTVSAIVFGVLGFLAGCGGSGGGGTVTPPDDTPTLQSIEVTPSIPSAAAGTSAQFTATGVFTDNSTQDLTMQVTWASSDDAVATVSNDAASKGLATTTAVGSTTVSATSDDVSGATMLTVTNATLVSIQVTPAAPSVANGLTRQFTATGLFTDNSTQNLTTQVTWASSDEAVATVSNAGLASATALGDTTVSATSGGVSGSATLTVTNATLVSIEVSPAAPSVANGHTQQFTANHGAGVGRRDQEAGPLVDDPSDEAVATVSNAGLASATAVGDTTVSATSGSVSGDTTLTVTDATLVSIEVTPAAPSVASGLTQQFTATGLFTDNSTQDLTTEVTWASSDETVAAVSNAADSKGLATTSAVGSTTVSATSGGVSGSAALSVTDATLVSIEVSPAAPSLANGLTQQFTATGLYTDNSTQDLTTEVTWASSDETVAAVSNATDSKGLATTSAVGSTTVSVTSGDVSGDTVLTVTDATLVSIDVLPAAPGVANGLTQQFTATGHFTDNSTEDLTTQVTWSSSDETVATVSNAPGSKGLAIATAVGSASVYATSGDVTGDTTLTVTDATLVSIAVSPEMPSLANGLTQQFTATGLFTDNSTQDLTAEVTWASSDEAVATVSNAPGFNGLATATAVGNTTVSATSGEVSGNTTLTVTDATLMSIEVVPAAPSVASGLTQQFTATGLFTDNTTQDLTTQVTWASSDEAVATVSNAPGFNGLATATAVGNTTVSATSGDVSGSATLTVTEPNLVSIDVSPAAPSVENAQTQQFTATGHFTDNTTQDLTTQVTWSSSDETVATVSNDPGSNGLATTTAVGSTTVSATSGDVSGSTTLTVTEHVPTVNELVADLLIAVTGVGPGHSLADKVELVQAYLAVPDVPSACSMMNDFKLQVAALTGHPSLPPSLAAQLTADAETIEAAIPCP